MKYIDTDPLRKEIEKRMRNCDVVFERGYETYDPDTYYQAKADAYQEILSFIDSLQQEQTEVDLDEEINRFWDSCIKHKNERGGNVIWSNKIEVEVLARHFYELGKNSK